MFDYLSSKFDSPYWNDLKLNLITAFKYSNNVKVRSLQLLQVQIYHICIKVLKCMHVNDSLHNCISCEWSTKTFYPNK